MIDKSVNNSQQNEIICSTFDGLMNGQHAEVGILQSRILDNNDPRIYGSQACISRNDQQMYKSIDEGTIPKTERNNTVLAGSSFNNNYHE